MAAGAVAIKRGRDGKLRLTRDGRAYAVRADGERYYATIAGERCYCTRAARGFLRGEAARGGAGDAPMERLPEELARRVLARLSEPRDLAALSAASGRMRSVVGLSRWRDLADLPAPRFRAALAELRDDELGAAQVAMLERRLGAIAFGAPVEAQYEDPDEEARAWATQRDVQDKREALAERAARRSPPRG